LIPSALATNLWLLRVFSTGDAKHDGEGVPVQRYALFVTYLATVLSFAPSPYSRCGTTAIVVGALTGRGMPTGYRAASLPIVTQRRAGASTR
jgi:hypothetical protein